MWILGVSDSVNTEYLSKINVVDGELRRQLVDPEKYQAEAFSLAVWRGGSAYDSASIIDEFDDAKTAEDARLLLTYLLQGRIEYGDWQKHRKNPEFPIELNLYDLNQDGSMTEPK